MNYTEAVAYLLSLERLGIKFGLENIDALAENLGRPERAYPSVLVAGTNGKGSTAALLDSILRAAGYRVGRYTSPHLIRLEERMVVSGRLIEAEELASIVDVVGRAARRLREQKKLLTEPTFFEVTTACAFEFFRRKGVEVAVLEVGMGGRWDATNIVPAWMTLITQIGLDHELYLGDTLEAIASEKAATIKPGRPVLVGPLEPKPLEVIRREAARRGARLFETEREVQYRVRPLETGQVVHLETPERVYEGLRLPLAGAHQVDNLAVAVRAAEVLSRMGIEVSSDAVRDGVASTKWPARLESFAGRPRLLVDSAHNPSGAAALARYLEAQPRRQRVLLFAVMEDKKSDRILAPLLPFFVAVVVTRPPNPRAMEPGLVAASLLERAVRTHAVEPTDKALARARRLAGAEGEVVVAGSIFLAGEVERILEEEQRGR